MRRVSFLLIFLVLGSLLVVTAPVRAGETQYYALSFDGEDDYVKVTITESFSSGFSIVAILRFEGIPNTTAGYDWMGIATKRRYNDDWGLMQKVSSESGELALFVGGTRVVSHELIGGLKNGHSYMLAATYDGSTAKLYQDGVLIASASASVSIADNYDDIFIGQSYDKYPFKGKIYLVLIYNRALSDSEIQAIYNDPLNPPTDGLVLFYSPDSVDTANNKWLDKSGHGNDGTIVGASYVPLRPVSEALSDEARALEFDGVDDYVKVDDFDLLSNSSFTFVWLGLLNDTSVSTLFQLYNSTAAWAEPVRIYCWNNRIQVQLSPAPGTSTRVFPSWRDVVKYNTSTMIAVGFNEGQISAWVDGINVGTQSVSVSAVWTTRGSLYIGRRNGYDWLSGRTYLVLIYSRALSDSEIQQIYENPENPPLDGLVLWYGPYSYDPSAGKWLNIAPIFPTIPLAEELDAQNHGATAERVSIPSLHVYDIENNSEIPVENVSVSLIANNTTISLIPSLLTLPYNSTVTLNVSAIGYLPRTLKPSTPVSALTIYLQPENQGESPNVEQAVDTTELVKNITSYVSITPINPYAKAFMDSGGSFGDTIKLALKGDSLMRLILPQVLILAIVIVVLVQTTSPPAALGGVLIGWAMSLGILGEAPSLRNSGMTFMLVVFLVAWTLWDLFYNYSRET